MPTLENSWFVSSEPSSGVEQLCSLSSAGASDPDDEPSPEGPFGAPSPFPGSFPTP
ncbi:MAG: hypothetical protein Q8P67_06935 [archaeon]|nr:hypothetical protein [archaeon]